MTDKRRSKSPSRRSKTPSKPRRSTKKSMKGGMAPYPGKDMIPTKDGNAVFNFGMNAGVSTDLLSSRADSNSAITPYANLLMQLPVICL